MHIKNRPGKSISFPGNHITGNCPFEGSTPLGIRGPAGLYKVTPGLTKLACMKGTSSPEKRAITFLY